MFETAIAHSIELDSYDAVTEILQQAHEQLGELKPQAGLLFAGIDHQFDLILKNINEVYPNTELIGCTTDGEIGPLNKNKPTRYHNDTFVSLLIGIE